MFQGFGKELIPFFLDLRFHNDKSFMDANRERYYREARQPFYDFIGAMGPGMQQIAEDMEVRHLRYNRRTAYIQSREESGHVFVIRPDRALGISRVEKDPEKLLRVYHLGRKQMEEQARELMDWLAEQS